MFYAFNMCLFVLFPWGYLCVACLLVLCLLASFVVVCVVVDVCCYRCGLCVLFVLCCFVFFLCVGVLLVVVVAVGVLRCVCVFGC